MMKSKNNKMVVYIPHRDIGTDIDLTLLNVFSKYRNDHGFDISHTDGHNITYMKPVNDISELSEYNHLKDLLSQCQQNLISYRNQNTDDSYSKLITNQYKINHGVSSSDSVMKKTEMMVNEHSISPYSVNVSSIEKKKHTMVYPLVNIVSYSIPYVQNSQSRSILTNFSVEQINITEFYNYDTSRYLLDYNVNNENDVVNDPASVTKDSFGHLETSIENGHESYSNDCFKRLENIVRDGLINYDEIGKIRSMMGISNSDDFSEISIINN